MSAIAGRADTTLDDIVAEARFTLGIGLSHRAVIEDMFGLSYARPARQIPKPPCEP